MCKITCIGHTRLASMFFLLRIVNRIKLCYLDFMYFKPNYYFPFIRSFMFILMPTKIHLNNIKRPNCVWEFCYFHPGCKPENKITYLKKA